MWIGDINGNQLGNIIKNVDKNLEKINENLESIANSLKILLDREDKSSTQSITKDMD